MPTRIALDNHFEAFVHAQVQSGRFSTASEVVQAGLRLLQEREADRQLQTLRTEISAGQTSGTPLAAEAVFNRLEAKYTAQADH